MTLDPDQDPDRPAEDDDAAALTGFSFVAPRVTDAVTQDNVTTPGAGQTLATLQSAMSLAQAQGALFANMVSKQQRLALTGQATAVKSVLRLLRGSGAKAVY